MMSVYDSVVALLPERASRTLQAKDEASTETQENETDTDDFWDTTTAKFSSWFTREYL